MFCFHFGLEIQTEYSAYTTWFAVPNKASFSSFSQKLKVIQKKQVEQIRPYK